MRPGPHPVRPRCGPAWRGKADCVPALATKGSVVDGVQFHGGAEGAGYDQFDGEPITWK